MTFEYCWSSDKLVTHEMLSVILSPDSYFWLETAPGPMAKHGKAGFSSQAKTLYLAGPGGSVGQAQSIAISCDWSFAGERIEEILGRYTDVLTATVATVETLELARAFDVWVAAGKAVGQEPDLGLDLTCLARKTFASPSYLRAGSAVLA